MIRIRLVLTLAILAIGLSLAACGQDPAMAGHEDAVVVEEVEGSDLARLTLSQNAAQRLDVQTAAVEEARVDGATRLVVPAGAVIWDAHGAAWVYTSPEALVFVRAPISIEHIDAQQAVLSDGPEPGTAVATVGVAELWGAETGVGGGH